MMSKPIKINVLRPCSENWELMEAKDAGRFCAKCEKTIIDFSSLSDGELYRYLASNPAITCGRFHNDQLNRNILPVAKTRFQLNKIPAAAAALLSLLTTRIIASETSRWETPPITQGPNYRGVEPGCLDGNEIIKGIVQDAHGNKVENAKILIGDSLVATTDKEGYFMFELKNVEKPFIFQIEYPGMVTIVRSYHPAMRSTDYVIVLESPYTGSCFNGTMGAFIPDSTRMPSISTSLGRNSKGLDVKMKTFLDSLSTALRNNPEMSIHIRGFVVRQNEISIARQAQGAIKKYLVDQQGISEDRFDIEALVIKDIKKSVLEISCFYAGSR